ncbi:hypothetical protein [Vibrio parahaemolyticus]|uniref:hypothetical protein n=1 Tax=Vibrio parahaemolyticus TaxID=670 RepID=UPI00073E67E9|nr:hypothetical protein [Vibrio parahaemolyticus]EGQ7739665.1 hypothetical protein [Vibrio parahaemolyticus]EJG1398306.1 hypothetical protein [Vibrio parahaemolyticus]KUH63327.1 hypothetical protein ABK16_06260 [Vibrio parahaemolyticus]KYX74556.1 hypothetical protein AU403_03340 [Vibrio parahaemolyticus]KYZ30473.1 hypothetical protein AW041_18655 [Vibrio parahaemolyticus]
MKVNPYISSSMSAPLSGTENHVGNQAVEDSVKNLDQALSLLESDPSCNADLKTLSDTVNNQRSALSLMSSRNAEVDIANSLQDSIDDYAKELELIGMWVEGGKGGFYVALDKIANNLFNQSSPSYEDLFQVALIDVLINAADYGLENDAKFMQYLSWCIEYIGTGQHNTWIDDLPAPPNIVENVTNQGINNGNLKKLADDVWINIYQKISSGDIPTSSLAYRAMSLISGGSSVSSTLPSSLGNKLDKNNYFSANSGGWITTTNNNMSPMMRLMLLTQALGDDDLSKAELETILTGNLKDINDLTTKKFNQNPYEYILAKDPIWQNSDHSGAQGASKPSGVTITLDYSGKLNQPYLTNLYQNHPSRVLGDDEITDINRIGDTVKMIQQTLKYWIQIMRDERMAVARNI